MRDYVVQQELQKLANAQYIIDSAKLDAIIARGTYISTADLFDEDDLLGE